MRKLQLTQTAKSQNLTASQIENSFFASFRQIYRSDAARQILAAGMAVTVALAADYYSVTVTPFTCNEFSIALFKSGSALPVAYAYCDEFDA